MAPVEWTVISGEQAEDVLSNLLYSEHTNAVRVRPSQGDLGIDVLVPVDATGEPFDVYQIKKFANTLDGRFFGRQRCLFGPHAVKFPLPQCFSEYWPHSDNRWHSILRE